MERRAKPLRPGLVQVLGNLAAPHRFHYLPDDDLAERRRFAFLDTRQVMGLQNVTWRFHSAKKHSGPVIVGDRPWETGGVGLYGSVTHDGEKFRMWYQSIPGAKADYPSDYASVAYAESADGVHWTRPDLAIIEGRDGSMRNNLTNAFGHSPSVIDLGPDADPATRYRAIAAGCPRERWQYDEQGRWVNGYHVQYSADGLRWRYYEDHLALPRRFRPPPGPMARQAPRRVAGRRTGHPSVPPGRRGPVRLRGGLTGNGYVSNPACGAPCRRSSSRTRADLRPCR